MNILYDYQHIINKSLEIFACPVTYGGSDCLPSQHMSIRLGCWPYSARADDAWDIIARWNTNHFSLASAIFRLKNRSGGLCTSFFIQYVRGESGGY